MKSKQTIKDGIARRKGLKNTSRRKAQAKRNHLNKKLRQQPIIIRPKEDTDEKI
ncbi:MAG: hypothetical protein U9R15_04750 [Chloroflexota bacterium]|nr:hypothetical protein [Chloroflexota bacterium]